MIGDFVVAQTLFSPRICTGEENKYLKGLCDFVSISRKPPLPERMFSGKGVQDWTQRNNTYVVPPTKGLVALAFCSTQVHMQFLLQHWGFCCPNTEWRSGG